MSRSRSRSLASRSTRERLPLQLNSSFGSGCAVIDHGGPQVSNNLSWHFIQAAALTKTKEDPGSPERGSKPGQAWAPPSMLDVFQHNFNLFLFFFENPHFFKMLSMEASRSVTNKPVFQLFQNKFSELGSRSGADPSLDVGKSSNPSDQVGNLRSRP